MTKSYRKKPVVIQALEFFGCMESAKEIIAFTNQAAYILNDGESVKLFVGTLEGQMLVGQGDFVIRGVAGEFYPCKSAIFAATYEEVV